MIIYFHGLGSSPESSKVRVLRDRFENVYAPSIPVNAGEAVDSLVEFCRNAILESVEKGDTKVIFVGTSLGGFWAAMLGDWFDAKQVLINPAMDPVESLDKYVGPGYCDWSEQTVVLRPMTEEIIDSYKRFSTVGALANRHFFIAKNDPVVKPYDVPEYHPNVRYYDSDDHQGGSFFGDVVEYLGDMIRQ